MKCAPSLVTIQILLLTCPVLPAPPQTDDPKLQFEVASVKRVSPETRRGYLEIRGGPGTNDPGRITYTAVNMKRLVETAYRLKQYEVEGPDWIESEFYDIVAKVPEGAKRQQVPTMLLNLLIDRFKLESHRESRDMGVYNLVLGKNGLKIKNGNVPESAPPGFNYDFSPGKTRLMGKKLRISSLTGLLTQQLGRPVFDKTGLTEMYDFVLEFLPEAGFRAGGQAVPPADQEAPSLSAAIQEQLGLRLEAGRSTIPVLVIDKVIKSPTEN